MHCTNTLGSYVCGCRHGYETVGTSCKDIDECTNQKICPDNSICQNTAGNYTCQCRSGFYGYLCQDIDECSVIDSCHANATCSNSEGSYSCSCNVGYHGNGESCSKGHCDDRSCMVHGRCVSPTSAACECEKGYRLNKDSNVCEDTDECLLGHDCHQNSHCINSKGSYSCYCNSGYFGNGETCKQGSCTQDFCSLNEECVSPTTLDCKCKTGFERNGTGVCSDPNDECAFGSHNCHTNAACEDNEEKFNCHCKTGYIGNGTSCTDIDECTAKIPVCIKKAKCMNTIGSFSCSCNAKDEKLCRAEWVLVLQVLSSIVKTVVDGSGRSRDVVFKTGTGTEISNTCSLVWQGKMFIFGGQKYKQQISVVEQCKLSLKGNLPFKMYEGACTQRNDTEVSGQ